MVRNTLGMALLSAGVATFAPLSASVAQQPPAIRPLGPVSAVSDSGFGEVLYVRHLKNGVLINDVRSRKLVMLDDKLANPTIVADSTPATASAYSGRTASLVPYRGDSSLFVDAQSMSMLVIAPDGKLTSKVMSIPRSQDAMVLGNPALGVPGFDPEGRLVYRSQPRPQQIMRPPQAAANPQAGGSAGAPTFAMPDIPDSAAVVRMNLSTRAVDTAGWVKTPKIKFNIEQSEGRISMTSIANPLPLVDDWAVLSDGSIALIRGRDYHIDWVRSNGTKESAAKMPFEWQRLSDDDKRTFIDSVKAARERLAAAQAAANPQPAPGAAGSGNAGRAPAGMDGPGAGGTRTMVFGDGPMAGGGGPARAGGGPGGPGGMGGPNIQFVPPDELPDYKPPFFVGNARADMDGRLWIRTIPTKGIAGGPVYDVINGKGELIERVQVPADRTIIGFGAGGLVYLRVASTSKIERASFK
jgi:hypothetical protein